MPIVITCAHCGLTTQRKKRRNEPVRSFCSQACYDAYRNKNVSDRGGLDCGAHTKIGFANCAGCGRLFVTTNGSMAAARRGRGVACSDECRRAYVARKSRESWPEHYERYKDAHFRSAHRYKARKAAAFVEDVEVAVLGARDRWKCHLCGKAVDRNAKQRGDRPSIDHLVPLSLGGEHSYANTALAHQRCNAGKSNRAVGEQLRLVG